MAHATDERFGLLLFSSGLQGPMEFADAQRAVRLATADALPYEGAVAALAAPLETEACLPRGLLFQPAAIRAGFAGGTDGYAVLHVHLKGVALEGLVLRAGFLGRADQLPALLLRFMDRLGRDVASVHEQFRGFLQAALGRFGHHLRHPGFFAAGGRLG